MNITIRRITIKDIGVIYQLGKSAPEFNVAPHSSGFWSQQALSNWLNKNDDPLLLAEENGEIIGFILCQFHWPTEKATIENILMKYYQSESGAVPRFRLENILQFRHQLQTLI